MHAADFTAAAAPSYPLADALASGVPMDVREDARRAGRINLTRPDGGHVPFFLIHPNWNRNGGNWTAKGYRHGRTLTGYAGGHKPRGGGIPGLSAAGIRRALDALDRQDRGPAPRCRCCGGILRARGTGRDTEGMERQPPLASGRT